METPRHGPPISAGPSNHGFLAIRPTTRSLTADEVSQRSKVAAFLETASEDDFTQLLLVPLFQRLGFRRVSVTGHNEKLLEYGKDLWMKCQLPTGHWIYFAVQIKREKLDARGGSGDKNTATVLDQVRMALDRGCPNAHSLVQIVFVISCTANLKKLHYSILENFLDGEQDLQD